MPGLEDIKEEVRSRNDIVDVVSSYVHLTRKGNNYFGLCPFHNEKSGSFSVNRNGQYFHCFGCHKGGDVFTFLCEYENITFPEAMKILADKAGIQLPDTYTGEDNKSYKRKKLLYDVNKEAATFFYLQLRGKAGEIGKRYFDGRRLSEETMKAFGLGFALPYTDGLVKYLRGKGFSDDIIRDSGVATFDERDGLRDKFINRVMFPIFDRQNKVIGFGGRVLGDGKPKYLNSPETEIFNKSLNLYALNLASKNRGDRFILCEGYMDVIALHQAGFTEAVASLGTAFTSQQAGILKRFSKDVYLAYDSDTAGVTACIRNSNILHEHGITGRVINMEPYKDPDEFIKNLGAEEFEKRIENAENAFMFEIRKLKDDIGVFDSDHPDNFTKFQQQIAIKLLTRFEESLERENYLDAVCGKYNIDKKGLLEIMQKNAGAAAVQRKPSELKNGNNKAPSEADNVKRLQRLLITYLVEDISLYKQIKDYISPADFADELYRKIAELLFAQLDEGNFQPVQIIGQFEESEEQSIVTEVFNTRLEALESESDNKKAFRDILISIKTNSIKGGGLSKNDALKAKKQLEELRSGKVLR